MKMETEEEKSSEEEKIGGKQSGWKLVEINRKYRVLEDRRAILDLCAAPGEWMKVAVDKASKEGCFVLGVDILPIIINPSSSSSAFSLQQDITAPNCSEKIKKVMEEHGLGPEFDLVLHDGVPDFYCGPYNALAVQSIKLTTQFLAPNGTFVTKAYRSQDFYPVLYCLNKLFETFKVVDFADRETYLIALKFKAPSSIDPRLLDTRHLFREATDRPKISSHTWLMRPAKYKIRKSKRIVCPARKFVWSDAPLQLLSSISHISFVGPACASINNHYLTTDEVRSACLIVDVLSKRQTKLLIQWHTAIREALTRVRKAAPLSTEVEPKERQVVNMLRETVELMHDMYRKKNRAKQLIAEQQSKGKKDLVAVDEDFEEEGKRYHEQLEDLLDQAYEIVVKKKYGSRKRKEKPSKDERYEVTFDDDVYDGDVMAALFSRCIFDSDADDFDADEVENKAKSVGEEKRGKGKVSSKQGESSNVIWKEIYFDSTEETLPKDKRKQVPASVPGKKHKQRESGKGCSVCRKRKYKELQRSKARRLRW